MRSKEVIAFRCEMQTANCVSVLDEKSKLHLAARRKEQNCFLHWFPLSPRVLDKGSAAFLSPLWPQCRFLDVGWPEGSPLWDVGSWGVSFCRHGTRCAGEVAAAVNNSYCIVGIAYNARIGGEAVTCPSPSPPRDPGCPDRAKGLLGRVVGAALPYVARKEAPPQCLRYREPRGAGGG